MYGMNVCQYYELQGRCSCVAPSGASCHGYLRLIKAPGLYDDNEIASAITKGYLIIDILPGAGNVRLL